MKLTYTPNNTKDTFVFEGSNEEIATIVNSLSSTAPRAPKVFPPKNNENNPKTTNASSTSQIFSNLKQETAFLKSIYLYAPNPKIDNGRGAYVAKQILDHKIVNIAALVKKANCTRDTVSKVVNKMRDAGAVIEMSDASVKLVSLPAGPYTPRKYTRTKRASANLDLQKFATLKSM